MVQYDVHIQVSLYEADCLVDHDYVLVRLVEQFSAEQPGQKVFKIHFDICFAIQDRLESVLQKYFPILEDRVLFVLSELRSVPHDRVFFIFISLIYRRLLFTLAQYLALAHNSVFVVFTLGLVCFDVIFRRYSLHRTVCKHVPR